MKRYLLFVWYGDGREVQHGWRGFHGSFDSPDHAKGYVRRNKECSYDGYHNYQIVDTQKNGGVIVAEGTRLDLSLV